MYVKKGSRTRIVILGGGFGGIYAYKYLHRIFSRDSSVEISLVDKKNYFLFTPLLHEVATGSLGPHSVTEPFRRIIDCMKGDFFMAETVKINTTEKIVYTSRGLLEYDYLVLALGATTNYFDTPGAEENCFTLKSLNDALALKNHILDVVEIATKLKDEREKKKFLHFSVIGGGATGVELAAEISEYLYEVIVKKYPKEIEDMVTISIIQKSNELIPSFPVKFRKKCLSVLKKKRIVLKLGTVVKSVGSDYIQTSNGEKIETKTPIWVAGIKPNTVKTEKPLKIFKDKIVVNEYLQLLGDPNIFALGDVCYFIGKNSTTSLPALAQVATRQAKSVAHNIERFHNSRKLTPFSFKSSGMLLSLGNFQALGSVGPFFLSGFPAWFFWRTIYLTKHITFTKRVKVGFDWFIELFSERDTTKI